MDRENASRSIKTHRAEDNLRLPQEVIEVILLRLPVKSLMKFRCVSKSWLSLIGSKRFIETHLQNSRKNLSFSLHRIILNPHQPYNRLLKQCSWPSLLNKPVTDSIAFDDSINIQWESIRFVGSCNGLVCILLDKKIFILWNPSTRMSKKLPDADDRLGGFRFSKFGFGYDESSDDYKVFGVMFCILGEFNFTVKVYSLKTNSWKALKDNDVSPFDGVGKFVSGNLHWRRASRLDSDIASFDLRSEVYGMIEQPSDSKGAINQTLGVIGGCLSVLCDYQSTHLDVWVMKEYRVIDSWVKVASLTNIHHPAEGRVLSPFGWGPNGEILLVYRNTFTIYYPKDNVFCYPQVVNIFSSCEADLYIESLVSLVSDAEQERQPPEAVV